METQTALAIPDEDNSMVVYSSTQFPEITHSVIARCLGVPENKIRVITRRVGGGFGGKALKSMPVSSFVVKSFIITTLSFMMFITLVYCCIGCNSMCTSSKKTRSSC